MRKSEQEKLADCLEVMASESDGKYCGSGASLAKIDATRLKRAAALLRSGEARARVRVPEELQEAIRDFAFKIRRWRKAYPRTVFPKKNTGDWIDGALHVLKLMDEDYGKEVLSALRPSKAKGRGTK